MTALVHEVQKKEKYRNWKGKKANKMIWNNEGSDGGNGKDGGMRVKE